MDMDMDMSSNATSSSDSMDMGSSSCTISMLWNWNTVDSCFISSTWHIRSRGMFAGSCIGVILLVMTLEFLRRATKEFDRYLVRQHQASLPVDSKGNTCASPGFRPNIWQQGVRALLHMFQFAVAYFVMLLAMYFNGYIIICIFIGAYLGSFVFQWERLGAFGGGTTAAGEATVCCG